MQRGWAARLRAGFSASMPVMFGYLPLGAAFGLLLCKAGYGPVTAGLMSVLIYAGAGQFLAVSMLASGMGLAEIALTQFLLNSRHMVYGLSLIERFFRLGPRKWYMIFALTDEAYALLVTSQNPEADFHISWMCQVYWIVGSVLGGVLGEALQVDTRGMDFTLTALFLVLTVEQLRASRAPFLIALGAGAGLLALWALGPGGQMPGAILVILLVLAALKGRIAPMLNKGGEGA